MWNNRCQLVLAAAATTIVGLKEKVKAKVTRVDEDGALKSMSISDETAATLWMRDSFSAWFGRAIVVEWTGLVPCGEGS